MEDERFQTRVELGRHSYMCWDSKRRENVFVRKTMREDDEHYNSLRSILVVKVMNFTPALLRDTNVIPILDFEENSNKDVLCVVYPFFEYNLKSLVAQYGLGPEEIKNIIFQVLRGVQYMHGKSIIHRNLTPTSILFDIAQGDPEYLSAYVGGYRLSRPLGHSGLSPLTNQGNLRFKAPELLLVQRGDAADVEVQRNEDGFDDSVAYTSAIDIWACGLLFAYALTGHDIFVGDGTERGQILAIFRILGTPTVDEWPNVRSLPSWHDSLEGFQPRDLADVVPQLANAAEGLDLLRRMLILNPDARISAQDCLDHPYFNEPDMIIEI